MHPAKISVLLLFVACSSDSEPVATPHDAASTAPEAVPTAPEAVPTPPTTPSAGGDWGRFVAGVRVEPHGAGKKVTLGEGDALRFRGTTEEWCGEANSGLRVISGFGMLLDTDLGAVRTYGLTFMAAKADPNMSVVNLSGITDTTLFVATAPTVIELVSASSDALGQNCGE